MLAGHRYDSVEEATGVRAVAVPLGRVTLGPLLEGLAFLVRLSEDQRRDYLAEPGNLRGLQLMAWEMVRRSQRFEGLSD